MNELNSLEVPTDSQKTQRSGLFQGLRRGLERTRAGLTGGLARLVRGRPGMDRDLIEEIETLLLSADLGIEATTRLIKRLESYLTPKQLSDADFLYATLREEMLAMLKPISCPLEIPSHRASPFVILMVGVNGTGKTTTIGKLVHHLQRQGRTVALAAADTFRAAAVEQLKAWGECNGVPVTAYPYGADPASVVFDALGIAKEQGTEILIVDTAGRLHTQTNLMAQLKKICRVMTKIDLTAPHETMLVIDATTGQNALAQVEQFHAAIKITGIALTKMDGTAKGGIIFALAEQFGIPVRFIGIGEELGDLQVFDAMAFVDALLDQELLD